MRAMMLHHLAVLGEGGEPLEPAELPRPRPADDEILVRVTVCGVCHTELDEIEGRTPPPRLPVVPGHQVIGRVEESGDEVTRFRIGDRVGVGWIFSACGHCDFCRGGLENLCANFQATGRDRNGGYAEYMNVPARFAYPLPDLFSDAEAAPLLCAGAIGYRSLRLTGLQDGQSLGLTGFGASGHLVLKMVRGLFPNSRIHVFSRTESGRDFARELGAVWAGGTQERPPELLRAVIDTTPAWRPIVAALEYLEPGGRLVVNAIRKEEGDQQALLEIDYGRHLWLEKEIKSVANVTRHDVEEFLKLAAHMKLRPEIQEYPLNEANRALRELKAGKIRGARVLRID